MAIVVATAIAAGRLHHLPASSAQWHNWLALFVFVAWISFGGHWVELAYLNGFRPRLANWSDASLVLARLGIWVIGGAILFLGAVTSRSLLTAGAFPAHSDALRALLFGGPIFIAVELLLPHAFLLLAGRPSFWNLRG